MNAFKAYNLADQKQGAHVNLITDIPDLLPKINELLIVWPNYPFPDPAPENALCL
jgi:hypothetical protein